MWSLTLFSHQTGEAGRRERRASKSSKQSICWTSDCWSKLRLLWCGFFFHFISFDFEFSMIKLVFYVDLAGRKKQLGFFFFFLVKTKRFCLCRDPLCNVVRHLKKIILHLDVLRRLKLPRRIEFTAIAQPVLLPAEANYCTTKHRNRPLIQPVRECVCVCVSCHSTRVCFFLWPLSSFSL